MTRKSGKNRQTATRARIAAAAARLMAEDGIDDFALAKRKAAKQLGVMDAQALPGNDEIEAELREYLALYQAEEHPQRIAELRQIALDAMRALEHFNPYLTGPVLKGIAGPYAEIELQLFPDSVKDVEIFLLDRNLSYDTREGRRYAGDR
ncbi:MAG TPA: UDP-N-acetylmuramate--alanine ligase, partial [Burkholderiales bacterium]|nr:UDP-N-acetylmuramate--alanine ligase [Burkholderiales bacterium]